MARGRSKEDSQRLTLTIMFRKFLLSDKDPPINIVIESGFVPRLVEYLTKDNFPQLQLEAACALAIITSGKPENTDVVIKHGAVPIFVRLLRSPRDEILEQAFLALGNIAGDSPKYRDLVLSKHALAPLLSRLDNEDAKPSVLRNATWALSNFCGGKPRPPFHEVKAALSVLAGVIDSDDESILQDACWALSYLSYGTNDKIVRIQAVIVAGICPRLIALLNHPSHSVLIPALHTVGNIVCGGDDHHIQMLIDNEALPCLHTLLTENYAEEIQEEVCWLISNIATGNEGQIQALIDANLIRPLVQLLLSADVADDDDNAVIPVDDDITTYAALAVSNATISGTPDHIKTFVNYGCIKAFCHLLRSSDTRTAFACLRGLEEIQLVEETEKIEGGPYTAVIADLDGYIKIDQLQNHHNAEIREKAKYFVQHFFYDPNDEVAFS